jgi:heme exporter protein B
VIARLIGREVRRGLAGPSWLPATFFLLVAILIPFSVGPDPRLLSRIAPGILWVAALTAALLPVERLVEPDRADGILDQLRLHGLADESVAAAKIAGHWLSFGPLLLASAAIAGLLLRMPPDRFVPAGAALFIGTLALAALAVAVAALTAGLPRAGSLAGLLLLPLAIPLLIFGASASGDSASGAFLLECAIALLVVAGAPFVAGAAIRAGRT